MDAPTAPAKPTNPRHIPSALGVVAKGVYIVGGLGNALSIDLGDGVVQIDTGLDVIAAGEMMARLRLHTASPVTTIVYSHGHLGYNFGVQAWLDVAFFERGHTPPVVAQVSAAKLVERFKRTTPLMKLLIAMEYHGPIPTTPSALPLFTPTVTFTDRYPITGSQRTMEVFSAPSETDGSIGAWIPDVKVLYGGPGCISMLPDIGMPLSPFRDATRWPTRSTCSRPTRPRRWCRNMVQSFRARLR